MIQTSPQTQIVFPVSGMTCTGCQSTVERALLATAGVVSAKADRIAGTATVVFDPERANVPQLIAAVLATGYGASAPR